MKKITVFALTTALLLFLTFAPIFKHESSVTFSAITPVITLNGFETEEIEISAEKAILLHKETGLVLYSKNADSTAGMASTTKIMTAIIILESMKLSDQVYITADSVGIEGSSLYLSEGEVFTVESLLYGLLLESGNDVAAALAIAHSGSMEKFAEEMNRTAKKLGMNNTNFTNSHGLSDEMHYSTARDMGTLAIYAMNNEIFREIVSTKKMEVKPLNGEQTRYCINHNKLLFNTDFITGIKTGYTKADGRCLVSSAVKDDTELICVTLNGADNWNDHKKLLNAGFETFEKRILALTGEYASEIPIVGGKENKVLSTNISDIELLLPRDAEIEVNLASPPFIYAPVKKGDIVGEIRIYCEDKLIYTFPLCAVKNVDVKKVSFFKRIFG